MFDFLELSWLNFGFFISGLEIDLFKFEELCLPLSIKFKGIGDLAYVKLRVRVFELVSFLAPSFSFVALSLDVLSLSSSSSIDIQPLVVIWSLYFNFEVNSSFGAFNLICFTSMILCCLKGIYGSVKCLSSQLMSSRSNVHELLFFSCKFVRAYLKNVVCVWYWYIDGTFFIIWSWESMGLGP